MNNKLKLIAAGVGILGVCAIAPQASANVTLAGSISFNGSFSANGTGPGHLDGATTITGVAPVIVGEAFLGDAPSGSFAGLAGDTASFKSNISLGATSTPAGVLFWTVNDGTDTYKFYNQGNLAASVSWSPSGPESSATSITDQLVGTGFVEEFANLGGAEVAGPSYGSWTLTVQGSGKTSFVFGDTTTTAPDGGLTVALLGGAFCALGAVRSKLARK